MTAAVNVWHLGRMGYRPAYELQKHLVDNYKAFLENPSKTNEVCTKDTLLIVEHDPVYTIGIRQKSYGIEEEARLKAFGAEFHRTDRGGLITFHGPGQLVVYPILYLKNYKCSGLRSYVSTLEEAVISTCEILKIKAKRSVHTGVWVGNNKICAIGIHASRHITSHGLALNCNINLDWFEHIVPCGIEGKGVTSLSQELGKDMTLVETFPLFLHAFCHSFKCEVDFCSEEYVQKILKDLHVSDI